jgi:hypothetical protein
MSGDELHRPRGGDLLLHDDLQAVAHLDGEARDRCGRSHRKAAHPSFSVK